MSLDENDDARATVVRIVDDARIAMFTTMTGDGRHLSRPMAVQEVEFDGDLWFFCRDDSDKVAQLTANPQVNVTIADDKHSSWTSISGRADVVRDQDKMAELWSAPLKVWFEDGLETPALALVRVRAESAEHWDGSQSNVKQLLGAVRAAVTDNPDAFPGINESTRLDQEDGRS